MCDPSAALEARLLDFRAALSRRGHAAGIRRCKRRPPSNQQVQLLVHPAVEIGKRFRFDDLDVVRLAGRWNRTARSKMVRHGSTFASLKVARSFAERTSLLFPSMPGVDADRPLL